MAWWRVAVLVVGDGTMVAAGSGPQRRLREGEWRELRVAETHVGGAKALEA